MQTDPDADVVRPVATHVPLSASHTASGGALGAVVLRAKGASTSFRIYHVDCKDTRLRVGGGRNGRLSSHLPWGDPRRGWDFVSTGRGDVPWEDSFRALAAIGYDGPISVE